MRWLSEPRQPRQRGLEWSDQQSWDPLPRAGILWYPLKVYLISYQTSAYKYLQSLRQSVSLFLPTPTWILWLVESKKPLCTLDCFLMLRSWFFAQQGRFLGAGWHSCRGQGNWGLQWELSWRRLCSPWVRSRFPVGASCEWKKIFYFIARSLKLKDCSTSPSTTIDVGLPGSLLDHNGVMDFFFNGGF